MRLSYTCFYLYILPVLILQFLSLVLSALLCKIAALRTFSLDKLQYRRERASGISSLAHFVAKDTIDHFSTLIKPLVYLSMFYFFSNPRSAFLDNYIVLLCLVYCVTGIAYTLAIFLEPGPSQLVINHSYSTKKVKWFFSFFLLDITRIFLIVQCSVLLPVVLTLVSTQPKDSQFLKILTRLCYPSWALEAFIVSNAKRYVEIVSFIIKIDHINHTVLTRSGQNSFWWEWIHHIMK